MTLYDVSYIHIVDGPPVVTPATAAHTYDHIFFELLDFEPPPPEPPEPDPVEDSRASAPEQLVALRAFDFPLRYTENSDLVPTTDEDAMGHNIVNSIMIVKNAIPLLGEIGSEVSLLAFDDSPVIERSIASLSRDAVAVGEPRVILDPGVRVLELDGQITAKMLFKSRITTDGWKTVNIPLFRNNG